MSVNLKNELQRLRKHVLTMGAMVEQRIEESIDALLERDLQEAKVVRAGDDDIDAMELDVEAECLRLLALSHPVARDLRFILAVVRINTDLERIGDLAKSIAKRVIALNGYATQTPVPTQIEKMAAASRRMLQNALLAFAESDAELARQVRLADDQVDDLLKDMFDWSERAIVGDVANTAQIIDLLSIARKLERVADSTTNIAEDVIFLTEGRVVRHTTT